MKGHMVDFSVKLKEHFLDVQKNKKGIFSRRASDFRSRNSSKEDHCCGLLCSAALLQLHI